MLISYLLPLISISEIPPFEINFCVVVSKTSICQLGPSEQPSVTMTALSPLSSNEFKLSQLISEAYLAPTKLPSVASISKKSMLVPNPELTEYTTLAFLSTCTKDKVFEQSFVPGHSIDFCQTIGPLEKS